MTPEELDKARGDEAQRIFWAGKGDGMPASQIAARLAREGWTPPEPVDPDVLLVRGAIAKLRREHGKEDSARAWESGDWDNSITVKEALAVLRAERERVAALEPKADADGWIKHDGGPQPVEAVGYVDVRFRGGGQNRGRYAPNMDWRHDDRDNDIIAWRRA